jgi:DNA repair protein RadD
MVHAAVSVCPDCGFEFPPQEKGACDETASNEGILTGEVTDTEYDVEEVQYHTHTKRGADESAPRTVRVDYQVGFNEYKSEWVCPEHSGWARQKFEKWWSDRSNDPPPGTADQAVRLADAGSLAIPTGIIVRKVSGEKFDRIIKYALPSEKPPAVGDLTETTSLCMNCVNSVYDDGFSLVCKLGLVANGSCSSFDGVTDGDINLGDVPF